MKKLLMIISSLVLLFILTGCSVKMLPNASNIRKVGLTEASQCRVISQRNYIDNLYGFGPSNFYENVNIKMLNEAVRQGGDSIFVHHHKVHNASFDVLICKNSNNLEDSVKKDFSVSYSTFEQDILNKVKTTTKKELAKSFIQPKNKKISCKIELFNLDSTNLPTVYWDGNCKNGYAEGIGRKYVITKDNYTYLNIGDYKQGKSNLCISGDTEHTGIYYGECKDNGFGIVSTILEKEFGDVYVSLEYGIFNSYTQFIKKVSPLQLGSLYYIKRNNVISYEYVDNSTNEFESVNEVFRVFATNDNKNMIILTRNKAQNSFEGYISNNGVLSKIDLSTDEISRVDKMIIEMKKETNDTKNIKSRTKFLESQYLSKICSNKKQIESIDDYLYFKTCNKPKESDLFNKLNIKVEKIKDDLLRKKNEQQAKRDKQANQYILEAQMYQKNLHHQQNLQMQSNQMFMNMLNQRKQTNCTSNIIGSQVYTTCY